MLTIFYLEHTNHVFTAHWLLVYSTLTIIFRWPFSALWPKWPFTPLLKVGGLCTLSLYISKNSLEPLHTSLCTQWLQHTVLWFSGNWTPHYQYPLHHCTKSIRQLLREVQNFSETLKVTAYMHRCHCELKGEKNVFFTECSLRLDIIGDLELHVLLCKRSAKFQPILKPIVYCNLIELHC